jgi:hypothetical protein
LPLVKDEFGHYQYFHPTIFSPPLILTT